MDISEFDINQIGADFIADPHPVLHALRRDAPLHQNPDGSVFLTRYEDCVRVYQSREMLSDKTQEFGKKFGDCPLRTHHTTSLVFNDPPYHTTVRKLISGAFSPRKLTEMEPVIERIVTRLVDDVAYAGELDLIEGFATALPTEIIAMMLGIPDSYRTKLRSFSLAILGALDPVVSPERIQAGNEAVTEFSELLNELIERRSLNPDGAGPGEVLDALITGEHDGRRLNKEELIQNCIFLLNAGHETTTSLVGNAIGLLLENPDQHHLLQANPDLITTAVEEVLRLECPLQMGNRRAAADIELPSGTLPKGTYIHTSIAAANRDPDVFDNPDEMDITRHPNKHIAFITGIHVCLGATLARIEGRLAIGQLVARLPNLRSNGTPERLPLARFRGYARLPIKV